LDKAWFPVSQCLVFFVISDFNVYFKRE
jgi:hypothetical protein